VVVVVYLFNSRVLRVKDRWREFTLDIHQDI
jgi:hypothetical protein